MKLLLDENLSDRLVVTLADLFPGTTHVKAVKLMHRPDEEVWAFAKQNGYIIVTKDLDFIERSAMDGPPPKVVYVQTGNCSTRFLRGLFIANASAIQQFGTREDDSALILAGKESP